ncbi:MAG: hypothetical protein M5R36_19680 [Deltaproteobacteria bacterium]|nr:hypothetical protein [Deltaproteobacteria bacterium]
MRIDPTQTALAGLRQSWVTNFKRPPIPSPGAARGSGDIVHDIVDLKLAKHAHAANLAVLKTHRDMDRAIIDLFV